MASESLVRAMRYLAIVVLLASGLFLVARYSGEWRLARATDLIDATLRGKVEFSQRARVVGEALALAESAAWQLPHDARRELVVASALTILGRGGEALARLGPEVVRAERPELVVALGRAYASTGDDISARAAFLRAGWAAPASLATLPRAARDDLLNQATALGAQLVTGQLTTAPPLPTAKASARGAN
jgi:hypothetical protein